MLSTRNDCAYIWIGNEENIPFHSLGLVSIIKDCGKAEPNEAKIGQDEKATDIFLAFVTLEKRPGLQAF